MNWVDLVIIVVLLFFIVEGLKRPFLSELVDLASFLFAFSLSLKFYNLSAKYFETWFTLPHSFANVLGFISIWYIFEIIFYILVRPWLTKFKNNSNLNIWQKSILSSGLLSSFPSFFKGLIFIAIILILVATFPIQPRIKKDVQNSKLAYPILVKAYQLEAPLKNIFGGLANDTLTFLTIQPKSNEKLGLGFQTDKFIVDSRLEEQMVSLLNKERVKKGLPELSPDPQLKEVARFHSSDMFKKGYFSHYSPQGENVADRAKKLNVFFLVVGENLAYAPSLELAHQGLMNSDGHRANILSPEYRRIGIGIVDGEEYGLMFTQVFTD